MKDPDPYSLGLGRPAKAAICLALCLLVIGTVMLNQKLAHKVQKVAEQNGIQSQVNAESTPTTPTTTSPTSAPTNLAGPGQHCGGFIKTAKICTPGYHCQLGINPDTGGYCVINAQ